MLFHIFFVFSKTWNCKVVAGWERGDRWIWWEGSAQQLLGVQSYFLTFNHIFLALWQRIAFNHTFLALWQGLLGNGLLAIQSYLPSTLTDCPRFTFNLGVMIPCSKSGVWNRYCCRGIFWSFLKSIIKVRCWASFKLVDFWHQIWTQHFNHHRYLAGITCLSENYKTASIALDPR